MTQYGSHPRQRLWVRPGSKRGGNWLIVIHGGAWRDPKQSEKSGQFCANSLAALFEGVASVTYRLAPEYKFPTQPEDVRDAIDYLHKEYAFEKIVLAGHSAGAYISGEITAWDWCPVPVALVVGIEGIYNLLDLLKEYPDYTDMIADCFGHAHETMVRADPDWSSVPLCAVHSVEDELLTLRQPELVSSEIIKLPHGKHDEVFETIDLLPRVRERILSAL
ncbi:Kynurenine formamidase [Wickerhamiella sorbophila]|uniref:Kynurenine formamidase n=1 Tax=Wickerhamiella sorbophila TaxID=45607 RepID=A0A2T0FCX0_9ASCO|nr:Kynurenine formamidase [Wickerhamiella sorbophila]PRT52852.1 Kynurenine formamidase [Wickerhamiella sorbophila]